jgi:hypothetical protein
MLASPSTNTYTFNFDGTNYWIDSGQILTTGSGDTNVFNISPTMHSVLLKGTNFIDSYGSSVGIPHRMLVLTNDVTVTNTVAETSLIAAAGLGTYTIPANYLTPGMTLQVHLAGKINDAVGATVHTVSTKMGSTIICSNVASWIASQANDNWTLDLILACRLTGASGGVKGQGDMFTVSVGATDDTGVKRFKHKLGTTYTTATVNTTTSQAFDITVTPGATTTGITTTEGYVLIIP